MCSQNPEAKFNKADATYLIKGYQPGFHEMHLIKGYQPGRVAMDPVFLVLLHIQNLSCCLEVHKNNHWNYNTFRFDTEADMDFTL